MKAQIVTILLIFLPCSVSASDSDLIVYVRNLSASLIDGSLPETLYGEWIQKTFSNSETLWEVNDCGEGGDGRTNAPSCVEVQIEQDDGYWLHINLVLRYSNSNNDQVTGAQPWMVYFYKSEGYRTIDVQPAKDIQEAVAMFKTEITLPNKKIQSDTAKAAPLI